MATDEQEKGSFPYAGNPLDWHWRQLPVTDRIITRSEWQGPCVVFTGAGSEGYGLIVVNGKTRRTHRVMWEALVGPIPKGMTLDHLCRNHACWWPDHLEVVPKGVNTLRGYGPTAQNRRRGLCDKGHEFTLVDGKRVCRECARERARAWRQAKKVA